MKGKPNPIAVATENNMGGPTFGDLMQALMKWSGEEIGPDDFDEAKNEWPIHPNRMNLMAIDGSLYLSLLEVKFSTKNGDITVVIDLPRLPDVAVDSSWIDLKVSHKNYNKRNECDPSHMRINYTAERLTRMSAFLKTQTERFATELRKRLA